jgi:hypothetical protein
VQAVRELTDQPHADHVAEQVAHEDRHGHGGGARVGRHGAEEDRVEGRRRGEDAELRHANGGEEGRGRRGEDADEAERDGDDGGDGADAERRGDAVGAGDAIGPRAPHEGADEAGGDDDQTEDEVRLVERHMELPEQVLRRPEREAAHAEGLGDEAHGGPDVALRPEHAGEGDLERDGGGVGRARGLGNEQAEQREHDARAAGDEEGAAPAEVLVEQAAQHEAEGAADGDGGVEDREHPPLALGGGDVVDDGGAERRVAGLAHAHQEPDAPEGGEGVGQPRARRRRAPDGHAQGDEHLAGHDVAEAAEDGAREQVAPEERRADRAHLSVRQAELFLDVRADGRDQVPIEVVEQVQPCQQEDDGRRVSDHGGQPG